LTSHKNFIDETLAKNAGIKDKLNDFVALTRQIELLSGHHAKITRFLEIYDSENWVFESIDEDGKKSRRLQFKPIDVSVYAESILFRLGYKVLMMSATVLNKQGFCESLGITDENSGYISIASPFPVENRPILSFPIGKMTQNEIDNSLPRLVEAVKNILEQHKNEKGIIHCHSYKITNFLKKNIKSKRLLTHSTEDREDVLNKHLKSDQPTVLLSPSMTEGVDLVDDASRFQVICKIPYPYLGDKLVVKRMNRWKWWYPLQTAKTIVQSIGRSVRNSKDYAVTYILDSDWSTFYNKNKKYFPDDFEKCIK
jgi:ATP-dependent DNA helicase DinG